MRKYAKQIIHKSVNMQIRDGVGSGEGVVTFVRFVRQGHRKTRLMQVGLFVYGDSRCRDRWVVVKSFGSWSRVVLVHGEGKELSTTNSLILAGGDSYKGFESLHIITRRWERMIRLTGMWRCLLYMLQSICRVLSLVWWMMMCVLRGRVTRKAGGIVNRRR